MDANVYPLGARRRGVDQAGECDHESIEVRASSVRGRIILGRLRPEVGRPLPIPDRTLGGCLA